MRFTIIQVLLLVTFPLLCTSAMLQELFSSLRSWTLPRNSLRVELPVEPQPLAEPLAAVDSLPEQHVDGPEAQPAQEECANCLGPIGKNPGITPCGHRFHQACLERWSVEKPSCPTCGSDLRVPNNAAGSGSRGEFRVVRTIAESRDRNHEIWGTSDSAVPDSDSDLDSDSDSWVLHETGAYQAWVRHQLEVVREYRMRQGQLVPL